MSKQQRDKQISQFINTSVADATSSLQFISDPLMLCDLLIECHQRAQVSREIAVRRRIAQLIKKK